MDRAKEPFFIEPFEPTVVYYDNHLVVVNKPSGMVTHEDGVHETTLRGWTESWVIKKFDKPGKAFVTPVHRLDQATSGLVVFAKTDKALSRMMEAFRERKVKKIYRLLTYGEGKGVQEGLWSDWLARDESYSKVVKQHHPEAKLAQMIVKRLPYDVDKLGSKIAYWEVELLTGRHHQIRVQFSSRGFAIVGDVRYGGLPIQGSGIFLHHARLEIEHPVQRAAMILEAPMPVYWPT